MQQPQSTPDHQPPEATPGVPSGVPVWHPKRWKDLPPNPPYGPINRPDMVGKAGPTITIDPRIFPIPPSADGTDAQGAPAQTKWLLWISGLLFLFLAIGLLYLLTYLNKPPSGELSAYNESTNPPATIAPSNPQEDTDGGQTGQDGSGNQGGQSGQGGQGQPGQGGSEPGQGGSGSGQGGSEGQGGSGRPGAPGDGVQGKGPGAGSKGTGSGGSEGQGGQGGSQGGSDQGGQGGSGSQGGGGSQRPPRDPRQPTGPQGPPAPGAGSSQATPTTQDPDRLKETPIDNTQVFMQLTLLPLGAEETGVTVTKPAQGRVEQVNSIKLKNGKTIRVTAFRGSGTRQLIEDHRRGDELDTEVVYGDVLTRDANPQLVGRMGADNELIGVLIEGDERIPVNDLESIANGMRFDFD